MPNDVPDWTSVQVMNEEAIPNSPFSFARDGATHNVTGVQLPVGTQWLVIATQNETDISNVVVTGTTTNMDYAFNTLSGLSPLTYVRVHPAIDATVNIGIGMANGAGSATVAIAFGAAPTVIDIDPTEPNGVYLQTDASVRVSTPLNSTGAPDVGVQIENTHPPAGMSANVNGPIGVGSIAAGATFTFFGGGGASVHTYLRKVQFSIEAVAATFGTIECPAGTVRANWDGRTTQIYDFDFDWLDCGANAALIMKNTSAANSGIIDGHGTANQT